MGQNWAIAIGINNYDNLQSLKYAERDAEVMKAWFEEEGKFDQVFLFTEDSPPIPASKPIPTEPTHARFLRFLNYQFETPLLKPEDNLWFFFAGHGRRYNDQDYLMFIDSDPQAVDRTAISVDYITQRLRRSGADNVVLFLDACRDEGSRGGLGIGEEKHQGVITFYSCTANQQSFEIDELQHGAFTHALLEGLRLQGEGNCATVERLARYIYNRVPQLNTYYGKQLQNPYFKADPPYKMYFILLKQAATYHDAQPLIDAAQRAELDGDLFLAKNLWKRLWGLPGVDDRAFAAIERIARKQQPSSTNTSSQNASSSSAGSATGQRSASAWEQEAAEKHKQEEAERKEQQQELKAQRKREQEAQRLRERQEAEARRKQQEAERKRQQEIDRRRKEQEAAARKQQREQQWQNFQQLLVNRRQFLKWAGLGGGGLITAFAASKWFQTSPDSNSPKVAVTKSPSDTSFKNSPPDISVAPPKITPPTKNAAKILELPVWTVEFETVTVNRRGEKVNSEQKQAKFVKEDLGNGVTLDMVYIPGGKFMMGTKDAEYDDDFFRREKPQHQVNVPAFCMGKYPITQAQWKAVASLAKTNRDLEPSPSHFKGDTLPVERISWDDAVEFCARLSKHTGKQYRLPSEAEWEYACRAGTITPFSFGETITTDLANYRGTDLEYKEKIIHPGNYGQAPKGVYREKTTEVGQFPANAFGLYDMHGNVWEWCQDTWHENYNGAPTDGSAWVSEHNNDYHLLRGCSWGYSPMLCRSAFRLYYTRIHRNYDVGFRVVVVVA